MKLLHGMTLLAVSFATLVVACGDAEMVDSEETALANGCPSPVEDRDAFVKCVKAKAGGGKIAKADASGKNDKRDRNGSGKGKGNGGTEREEANGGTVQIGNVDTDGCTDFRLRCDDDACVCTCNGEEVSC